MRETDEIKRQPNNGLEVLTETWDVLVARQVDDIVKIAGETSTKWWAASTTGGLKTSSGFYSAVIDHEAYSESQSTHGHT